MQVTDLRIDATCESFPALSCSCSSSGFRSADTGRFAANWLLASGPFIPCLPPVVASGLAALLDDWSSFRAESMMFPPVRNSLAAICRAASAFFRTCFGVGSHFSVMRGMWHEVCHCMCVCMSLYVRPCVACVVLRYSHVAWGVSHCAPKVWCRLNHAPSCIM